MYIVISSVKPKFDELLPRHLILSTDYSKEIGSSVADRSPLLSKCLPLTLKLDFIVLQSRLDQSSIFPDTCT
jgi:hypothetical protein